MVCGRACEAACCQPRACSGPDTDVEAFGAGRPFVALESFLNWTGSIKRRLQSTPGFSMRDTSVIAMWFPCFMKVDTSDCFAGMQDFAVMRFSKSQGTWMHGHICQSKMSCMSLPCCTLSQLSVVECRVLNGLARHEQDSLSASCLLVLQVQVRRRAVLATASISVLTSSEVEQSKCSCVSKQDDVLAVVPYLQFATVTVAA